MFFSIMLVMCIHVNSFDRDKIRPRRQIFYTYLLWQLKTELMASLTTTQHPSVLISDWYWGTLWPSHEIKANNPSQFGMGRKATTFSCIFLHVSECLCRLNYFSTLEENKYETSSSQVFFIVWHFYDPIANLGDVSRIKKQLVPLIIWEAQIETSF